MKKYILSYALIAILSLAVIVLSIIALVGNRKCISTEYEEVEVTIVDKYYKARWLQPVIAGQVRTVITHPAKYHIIVEYNGVQYHINDSSTYYKYEDKIGQVTTGTLRIQAYDDGSVRYDIISLE